MPRKKSLDGAYENIVENHTRPTPTPLEVRFAQTRPQLTLRRQQLIRAVLDNPEETAIAIVGRPNVGKSSLLNRLLKEERSIVNDMPGTTRDTVDATLRWHKRNFRIVDTAGIRRPGRVGAGA